MKKYKLFSAISCIKNIFSNLLIFLALITSNAWSSEVHTLEYKVKNLYKNYPIAGKELIFFEVSFGDSKYKETAISLKTEIMESYKEYELEEKEIRSKIKTKDDFKEWKPRLDEIYEIYEMHLLLLTNVVDHIVVYGYNTNNLIGVLLSYCEGTSIFIDDYSKSMDDYSNLNRISKHFNKNQKNVISKNEWVDFVPKFRPNTKEGIKCENLKYNALAVMEGIKAAKEKLEIKNNDNN